jgi:fructose-specific phosphotransferase system IIC component
MDFAFGAIILGVAAVYVVPFVSNLLKGIVPQSLATYLPQQQAPGFSTQAIVSVVVYGALLGLVLMAFRRVGLRARA